MQIPLLTGIFTDNQADFRANYPRNMIPIALDQGISTGYLRPADGIIQNGEGPGINRGGILWEGALYRVRDAFLAPKPYPSWTLDEATTNWTAPVPKPEVGRWAWDEEQGAWVEAQFPAP